jgi:hypothetical protein
VCCLWLGVVPADIVGIVVVIALSTHLVIEVMVSSFVWVKPFHVMVGGGDQIYNDGIRVDGPLKPWTMISNPHPDIDLGDATIGSAEWLGVVPADIVGIVVVIALSMHGEKPFHVMVGGGDQIYNDGIRVDGPLKPWTMIVLYQRT